MDDSIIHIVAILCAAIAAYTDFKSERIPNWLTFSLIFFCPLLWLAVEGWSGLLHSGVGLIVCGFVPFMAYQYVKGDTIFGGDVKLFAGLGALTGPTAGIEIQFFSMLLASVFAFLLLLKNRRLITAFSNLFYAVFNRFLPKSWRRTPQRSEADVLIIGPYVFLATLFVGFVHNPSWKFW